MDINSVTLIGRMTREPEMRYTKSGKAVTSFGMAVEGLKGEDGVVEVGFFSLTAWGKTAEFVAQYLDKGARIGIAGRLRHNVWYDSGTGEKQQRVEIVAERVQPLEGKEEADRRRERSGQATADAGQGGVAADDGPGDDPFDGDEGGYEGFPTS